ncbi:ATP-binding protein [Actinomadura sp. J1-007]|uniref:ATP-binding protein n=1 Tax=Actinomadura sp. J1-007 TaxID=2661913 RepID=UPI0019D584FB|nr:ATP-binding protein [Actinomadura sp. J1-007]
MARYQRIVGGPEFGRFQSLEDRLSRPWPRPQGRGGRPPVDIGAWRTSVEAVDWQLDGLSSSVRAAAADRARAAAFTGLLRLGLAGGVGLLAVLAAITVAVRVGRRLIRESRSMSDTVTVFARDLLPTLADAANVHRNGRSGRDGDGGSGADGGRHSAESGDAEDQDKEAGDGGADRGEGDEDGPSEAGAAGPGAADPGAFTIAEIARIAEAFEEARQAVVRAAEGEAAAHKRLNDVIVTLARRNQSLLQRLLARLETLQRRADRPEELETLFELDHLATRMRRHAEGLVVLSGRPAGRTWRNPVRLVDVARAAAAEVEDYTRVEVEPMGRAALVGPVVADTVHLLAELIENGVAFSPPPTMVRVRGERVGRGFAVEIEDRGLGLSAEELARCNELLATDPEPELGDTARLGLFVVARLAARHAIGVTLRPSPFGGITAIVLVPLDLVVAPPGPRPPALRLGEGPTELAAPDRSVPAPERSVPPTPLAAPVPEDEEGRAPVRWNVPDEPVIRAARAVEAVRGAQAARADAEDGPLPTLPVRRRGEHMAPELRGTPEWAAGQGTEQRSPEDARRLLTTMQEGLQKGRASEAAGAERPDAEGSWLVRTPKPAKLAEDVESGERAEDAVSEERGGGGGGAGESGSAVGEDEGRSGGVGGGGE